MMTRGHDNIWLYPPIVRFQWFHKWVNPISRLRRGFLHPRFWKMSGSVSTVFQTSRQNVIFEALESWVWRVGVRERKCRKPKELGQFCFEKIAPTTITTGIFFPIVRYLTIGKTDKIDMLYQSNRRFFTWKTSHRHSERERCCLAVPSKNYSYFSANAIKML